MGLYKTKIGGTSSKTTAQILNDIAVNATMNSIQSCATVASSNQMIALNNIKGNVTITGTTLSQGSSIDMSCVMHADKTADISNSVASAISQYADSQGQAVLSALGSTKAEATTNISNRFQNNINANTELDVNNNISQNQSITAANVGGNVVIANVTLQQSSKIVAHSLMQSTAFASVINDSATKMDQSSKAKETTIIDSIVNGIKSFFTGIAGIITAGVVVFLLIGFVLVKLLF